MTSFILAAALTTQCAGGYCPRPSAVIPAPVVRYAAPTTVRYYHADPAPVTYYMAPPAIQYRPVYRYRAFAPFRGTFGGSCSRFGGCR